MSTPSGGIFQPLDEDDPTAAGGYRLAARLGAGGMGKVYLSYTPAGRPVAVKVIRPELADDPEFRRRFKQEVAAAKRVQGLFTAPVIDSDAEGTRPWLATAYVQGPTLTAAVAEHGRLPVPTVLLLVAGIAEALQAVHAAGLVHRDLKPSNVLLAADGPRVIDFGIARAADSTALTGSGVTIGTPAFMAPEQAAGREITPATDVFALGQVAAYAALGAPAYGEGSSHAVLYRIVHEEPDLTALPPELRSLVGRCLAKEPGERPSLAQVVTLCQDASDGTRLVRPEQWLPGAVAAQIAPHGELPGAVPQPTRPDGPPQDANGGYAPTAPATAPPVPHSPPVPQSPPAHDATPAHVTPPVPDSTPVHHAQPVPHAQPTQPAGPPVHPAQPSAHPSAQPPVPPVVAAQPAAYQQPQHPAYQHQQNQHHRPTGPAPYSGPYPSTAQQPFPQAPLGQQPARKRSRKAVVLAAVVGVLLVVGAGAAVSRLGGGGDKDKTTTGASAPSARQAPAGSTTAPDPAGGAADPDTASPDETGSTAPAADPAPHPEVHQGIQLAEGYHLEFGDQDLQPRDEEADDFYYGCSFDDCDFASYDTKLVLLDQGEAGSLSTCKSDTRYTKSIPQARLAVGAQICARTKDGVVALVTFKKASKSTEPSKYAVFDVTVWRNALPADDDDDE